MDSKLIKALGNKYSFTIANGSGSDELAYILSGIYHEMTVAHVITQSGTTPFAVSGITQTHTLITPITGAGYATGVVVDDGTVKASVVCTPADSKLKIQDFKKFLQFFPQLLKGLTIAADNVAVFNESLIFVKTNPLVKRPMEVSLNLAEYFDTRQFQTGKIDIDLTDNGIILDASTLMYMNIAAGRTVTFTFKF